MIRKVNFRARSHLLKLLGDELIGNDSLAIFELVKNSYDANATKVEVVLDLESLLIRVNDNGSGMTLNTIENVWMELGTDSKRGKNRSRTPEPFERLPLGEKGVGRLAVHKLGTKLKLVTRSSGKPEFTIDVDWPKLIEGSDFIEDAGIEVIESKAGNLIPKYKTGTMVEIVGLHKTDWNRGEIRNLHKLITSIVSPFSSISDFKVDLQVPGHMAWLNGLPSVQKILDRSIWKFVFTIDQEGLFSYEYEFTPPTGFKKLEKNRIIENNIKLDMLELSSDETFGKRKEGRKAGIFLDKSILDGIGPLLGDFYFYSRQSDVLNADGNANALKQYLDEQSGVRVYRDGIRVFNYGEPGNDWLGLNAKRVNQPGKTFSTTSILAAIDLNLENSQKSTSSSFLKEKTNREGFDENYAYQRLKWIMLSVFDKFSRLHRADRERLKNYIDGTKESKKPSPETTFDSTMGEISTLIEKHGLKKEVGDRLNYISIEYKRMRDFSLNTGLKGLNLAVIFHEVEREIDYLNGDIKSGVESVKLATRVDHLVKLMEGFRPLLKRNEEITFNISKLIRNTLEPMQRRFQYHGITVSSPVLTGENEDFSITAPYGLLMASVQNLINNSMYWSRFKAEADDSGITPAIGVFTLPDWFPEGPALVVADNGNGFTIPPEEALGAFITDRVGGAGLGLYFVNLVMENIGGKLLILEPDELELPAAYSGAAVVIIFSNKGS